jgi:hypothetical protein
MKEYVSPWLEVYTLSDCDVLTLSNMYDNNFEDDGSIEWE